MKDPQIQTLLKRYRLARKEFYSRSIEILLKRLKSISNPFSDLTSNGSKTSQIGKFISTHHKTR